MASIRKRGRKPNHWTVLTYVGNNKYDRYAFVGTKTQAKRAARDRQAAQDRGELLVRSDVSTRDWLEEWYRSHRGDLAPSTRRGYRTDLDYLTTAIGDVPLAELGPQHIRDLIEHAFETGNRATGGALSDKTVRNRLALLRLALEAAVDEAKAAPHTLRVFRRRKRVGMSPRVDPLTWDETQYWLRLTEYIPEGIPVWLALCAGLRRGEVLGLRRCDIDLDARVLHVRQTLWWNEGTPVIKEPKTPNSRRTIGLPPRMIEVLRRWFAAQDRISPPPRGRRDERLVWAHPDGRPCGNETVTDLPARLTARYGLRRIRFHDLRHTFATLLLESGVSMNAVSLLLGHSDVGFTVSLYGHVTPRSQRRVREVFDALFDERDDDDPPLARAAR